MPMSGETALFAVFVRSIGGVMRSRSGLRLHNFLNVNAAPLVQALINGHQNSCLSNEKLCLIHCEPGLPNYSLGVHNHGCRTLRRQTAKEGEQLLCEVYRAITAERAPV